MNSKSHCIGKYKASNFVLLVCIFSFSLYDLKDKCINHNSRYCMLMGTVGKDVCVSTYIMISFIVVFNSTIYIFRMDTKLVPFTEAFILR